MFAYRKLWRSRPVVRGEPFCRRFGFRDKRQTSRVHSQEVKRKASHLYWALRVAAEQKGLTLRTGVRGYRSANGLAHM